MAQSYKKEEEYIIYHQLPTIQLSFSFVLLCVCMQNNSLQWDSCLLFVPVLLFYSSLS